jgi:hypothetical protein
LNIPTHSLKLPIFATLPGIGPQGLKPSSFLGLG